MRRKKPIGRLTKHIASRIKVLRKANDATVAEAARDLGITQSYLSQLERGSHPFDVEFLQRVATTYGVSTVMLIQGEDNDEYAKVWSIMGKPFADAYKDETFKALVVALARAHRNQGNNWTYTACRRLLQL